MRQFLTKQNKAVVVPNWNGKDSLAACLDSLRAQSAKHSLIIVENGSTDGSLEYLRANYPSATLIVNRTNLGFAGGVNCGIKKAIELKCDAVALFGADKLGSGALRRQSSKTLRRRHTK